MGKTLNGFLESRNWRSIGPRRAKKALRKLPTLASELPGACQERRQVIDVLFKIVCNSD
jgi:hypothetical protein